MLGKTIMRLVQVCAIAVIWTADPTPAASAEQCPHWGDCVPVCTNPQGVCDNAPPECAYSGSCTGIKCGPPHPGWDHVLCIPAPM